MSLGAIEKSVKLLTTHVQLTAKLCIERAIPQRPGIGYFGVVRQDSWSLLVWSLGALDMGPPSRSVTSISGHFQRYRSVLPDAHNIVELHGQCWRKHR